MKDLEGSMVSGGGRVKRLMRTPLPVASVLLLLAALPCCDSPADRVERLRKSGDVKGLVGLYADFRREGRGTDARNAMNAIGATGGKEAEAALLSLRKDGDRTEREQALALLVAMKSPSIVPDLISMLLNKLQTGGGGRDELASLQAIDPEAVKKAFLEMRAKADDARRAGSMAAAQQYLENAKALRKIAGGGDLAADEERLDAARRERRRAELGERLLDAMENGQLSRSLEIARALVAETGDAALEKLLPEIERLSRLEDAFYATAQAQEAAKSAYDGAVKAGLPKVETDEKRREHTARKGDMVLTRRALERGRKKLPFLTERVREAAGKYMKRE